MSAVGPGATEQRPLPPIAVQLGYGGLVPFVALAALAWAVPELRAKAQGAQLAYGALILSFLGAVHWGLALAANRRDALPFIWGVIPSLLGWTALLLPYAAGAVVCTVSLIICWAADRKLLRGWAFARAYDQLRFWLTVVAWLSVIVARTAPHV